MTGQQETDLTIIPSAPSIAIDPQFKALIPPLSDEEYRQLEENLQAEGCRDPLLVWAGLPPDMGCKHCNYENNGWEQSYEAGFGQAYWKCQECGAIATSSPWILVDGHNRYEICTRLGIEYEIAELERVSDIELSTRADVTLWIIRNQLGRRNLSSLARIELALRLKPAIEAKAKENQRGGQGGVLLPPTLAEATPVETRREVAKAAAVGHETLRKAEVVLANASESVKKEIHAGETTINAAYNDIVKEQKRQEQVAKVEAIAENNAPLEFPDCFPLLYADPPWRYEFSRSESREIENQYPTMDLAEICALPVPDAAACDSVLFLWATSPKLADSLKVMEAWGFSYVTCMVWVKDRIGMGYYARQRHELLLIGKRGALPVPLPADRPDSVIEAPRGEHSAKPEVVYELLERMYPGLPKVELFSRSPRAGWAAWGNQV